MKIVKIINSLGFGGIERVFEIVAKYYSKNKNDLIFIALGKGGAAEEYIRSLGYKVLVLDSPSKIPNVGLIFRLYNILRNERAQVVHTCGAEANFHGLISAWMARVPVRIGEEIGMPSHSNIAKRVFGYVFKTANSVISVAGSVAEYLRVHKEVSPEKLKIIYNPVDIEKFTTKQRPQTEHFVIVSVCRLHPIKNLKTLLSVFEKIHTKYSHARLWLVGDGEQRKELETFSIERGLTSAVKFWGYQNDPSSFLAQASVFILPSFSEGHPVSLIEAMVMGVPSIATKIGGAPEIIVEDVNGWLIDPHNAQNIFNRLEYVMLLPEERKLQIAANAKKAVVSSFSPSQYLKFLEDLYLSHLE